MVSVANGLYQENVSKRSTEPNGLWKATRRFPGTVTVPNSLCKLKPSKRPPGRFSLPNGLWVATKRLSGIVAIPNGLCKEKT